MHVPKGEARALESYVVPTGHALSSVQPHHDVKPFVASLIPWSTWYDTVELAQRSPRFRVTHLAPAVRPLLDLRSTADGGLTWYLCHEAGTPDTRTA
jgi:hypothetical protein